MVFFLAVLFVLVCYGITFSGPGSFNESYLDKKHTAAINGIFVILVVFSHYSGYAHFGGVLDAPYLYLKNHLAQMIVATFLFYSGYGMMEQIRKRGFTYVKGIPKRAGRLLFRFDAAVLLFLVMQFCFGRTYKLDRIILSLAGWKSVGNSNWYIFDILVLYVLMFAAFVIAEKISLGDDKSGKSFAAGHRNLPGLILFTLLTIIFIYIMMHAGKGKRWYNTIILFPAGCFFSEFRIELERIIRKNDIIYFISLLIMAAVYCFTYVNRKGHGIEGYTVWALAFIAMVILVTMKLSIYNNILEWLGRHVFSIYMLQRIPMLVLNHFGLIEAHKYLCLIAVFALTIPMAIAFEKATALVPGLPGAKKI